MWGSKWSLLSALVGRKRAVSAPVARGVGGVGRQGWVARRGRPKVRRGPASSHDFNRKDPRPSGQRRTNCASPASRSTSAAAQFRLGPGKQTCAPGPVFVIRGRWARDGGSPLQFRISCAVYGATGGAGTPGGAGAANGAAGDQAEREARASCGGTDHLQVVHSFKAPSTTAFLTLRTSHRAGGATR
jgi:hypothetical protein